MTASTAEIEHGPAMKFTKDIVTDLDLLGFVPAWNRSPFGIRQRYPRGDYDPGDLTGMVKWTYEKVDGQSEKGYQYILYNRSGWFSRMKEGRADVEDLALYTTNPTYYGRTQLIRPDKKFTYTKYNVRDLWETFIRYARAETRAIDLDI